MGKSKSITTRYRKDRRPALLGDGVLDGIAYLEAVPNAAYLVSIQLHRSLLGRAMFPGIAVARAKAWRSVEDMESTSWEMALRRVRPVTTGLEE